VVEIVSITQKNPKEAITSDIWIAVAPQIKAWLESSSFERQKINVDFIFRSDNPMNFLLVSEIAQHDEFEAGIRVKLTPRRQGLHKQGLVQRLEHAEKSIKPVILETLAVKPSAKRSCKVHVVICTGVCLWVEKVLGVMVSAEN
jgi:hypothetical protein